MCGMGGDLFALVHRPGDAAPAALNASGRAGSGADADRLRAEGHTVMPAAMDIRAVPVPGCVDGWLALHERFGRLPLADVLEPARAYAEDGFPPSPTLAASATLIAQLPDADDYRDIGSVDPPPRRRPRAEPTSPRAAAPRFYEGEFGEGLLALGAGEYTADDLARVHADWVEPVRGRGMGPRALDDPAQLAGLPHAGRARGSPQGSTCRRIPTIRRGRTSRSRRHARPATTGSTCCTRAPTAPRSSTRPGSVRAATPSVATPRPTLGEPAPRAGGTMYLCAVDGDRMGVSLIQSNAAGFGCGLVVPGVRIFLQNRGLGFSLEPGHPAEYGPGRRPPHTLSPALVTHPDGALDRVIGTMGGDTQPQILLQLLARQLHGRQSPGRSIAAGRWGLANADGGTGFDTWRSRGRVAVRVEGQAPVAWDDGLRQRGHTVQRAGDFDHGFGHAHVIVDEGDRLAGAADPRALVGAASGY